MNHFLKYKNRDVVFIETTEMEYPIERDLRSVISLGNFGNFLIETSSDKQKDLIHDVECLSQLDSSYRNDPEEDVDRFVSETLKQYAEKWNLEYRTEEL